MAEVYSFIGLLFLFSFSRSTVLCRLLYIYGSGLLVYRFTCFNLYSKVFTTSCLFYIDSSGLLVNRFTCSDLILKDFILTYFDHSGLLADFHFLMIYHLEFGFHTPNQITSLPGLHVLKMDFQQKVIVYKLLEVVKVAVYNFTWFTLVR